MYSAVTISSELADGGLEIAISDEGPGVPNEERERIFARFESRSAGNRRRGAGLGLSIVESFVQLHGGTGYLHGIEVERHYRDARILPIGGGATEVLSDLAARLMGYAS